MSLFEEKTAKDVYNKSAKLAGGGIDSKKHARRTSTGVPLAAAAKGQKGSLDPSFLAFIAQTIAFMPFDVQEEPLFVVYHISRHVSLEGGALLSELKKLFVKAGVKMVDDGGGGGPAVAAAGGGIYDADDDSDSDLDMHPHHRPPSPRPANEDMMDVEVPTEAKISSALLAEMKDKCAAGMAFCLLLRLKYFLKQVYSLNDAKCAEYKPVDGT